MNTSDILWLLAIWGGLSLLTWALNLMARGAVNAWVGRIARCRADPFLRFGIGGGVWGLAVYLRILSKDEGISWWSLSGPDALFLTIPFIGSLVGLTATVARVGAMALRDVDRNRPTAGSTAIGSMALVGFALAPHVGWWVIAPLVLSYGLGTLVMALATSSPASGQDKRGSGAEGGRGRRSGRGRRADGEGGARGKSASGGREGRSGRGGARETDSRGATDRAPDARKRGQDR